MKKKIILLPLIFLLSSCSFGLTSNSSQEQISNNSQEVQSDNSQDFNSSINEASSSNNSQSSSQTSSQASSDNQDVLENINYVKIYSPSEYNYIYAWTDSGNQLFGAWPGTKITEKYGDWWTYSVRNYTKFGVVLNNGNGDQSGNLEVSSGNGHYFYVDGALIKSTTVPKVDESGDVEIEYPLPENKKAYRNYYQLLVYSFADSNNDGVGDFKGIKNKLGYLKQLGIESIWLSPINECHSYHGYDVTNYYAVNSLYEVNNYKLTDLIRDAHNEGIEIVLDLVLNHVYENHEWVYSHPTWFTSDNQFSRMKEFNFDNKEVRQEMKKVGKYWLDKGVDGFRLDAALWIYNSGSTKHKKNYAWWNEWCNYLREFDEDVYIIGEVLDDNHDLAYDYAQAGFNSTFDFEAVKHTYKAVTSPTYKYAEKVIADMDKAFEYNPNYVLGRTLSNHDIGRISAPHKDSGAGTNYLSTFEDLRLANAINILTPGNTFLYYGDELGLVGTCPQGWDDMNERTPMPFGTNRTNSVSYFNGFKGNGVTTSTTLSGQTAEEDQNNPYSLYSVCSALLNLKIEHPTIKKGILRPLDEELNTPSNGLNGFEIHGEENIRVIYNSLAVTIQTSFRGTPLYCTDTVSNNSTNLSSKGFLVYKY